MTTVRHENFIPDSPIRSVISYVGNDCGLIGPRIMIQDKNWSDQEVPRDQIADFLNDAVSNRTISEEVEKGIAADFSDVLKREGGSYVYTGSKLTNQFGIYAVSYAESKQQRTEQEELLAFANARGQEPASGKFTSKDAQGILQHEIAITDSNSQKPILGTLGAEPCLIVAVYNPSTRQALLTHIDVLAELSSLVPYLDRLSAGGQNLQAHLAGGNSNSRDHAANLIKLLKERGNIDILSANIGDEKQDRLAIDSRTGEVFTKFESSQLDHGKDLQDRLQKTQINMSRSPLSLYFDGTKLPKIKAKPKKTLRKLLRPFKQN